MCQGKYILSYLIESQFFAFAIIREISLIVVVLRVISQTLLTLVKLINLRERTFVESKLIHVPRVLLFDL